MEANEINTNGTHSESESRKVAEDLCANQAPIQKTFIRFSAKAQKLLNDPNAVEHSLQRMEEKLQRIPVLKIPKFGEVNIGQVLSTLPTLASLMRSYIKKEYTALPLASAIGILAALLYFIAPGDLIPDFIPVLGYLDDVLILKLCLSGIESDVECYRAWRSANGKDLHSCGDSLQKEVA